MAHGSGTTRWLPEFRRSLAYLRPHTALLVIGLLAAIGVSVSYTFSLSTIVPILKVMFSGDESLVAWLHRAESERRLGITIPPDTPDDPAGLTISGLKPISPAGQVLREGDRIVALSGQSGSAHELMRILADFPGNAIRATVVRPGGVRDDRAVPLKPYWWWWHSLRRIATRVLAGADAAGPLTTLAVVMGVLVLVALLGGVCRFINDGLVNTAVQRAMHDLRSHVAEHALRLPLDWHSAQPPGDALARLATDISKVEVGQATLFGKVIREPLKAVGVLGLTLLIDWHLLVVALIGLPIGAWTLHAFGRLVKRAQRRASQSWGRLLDHLGERFWGIRIVKAYGMEAAESRRFAQEGRTLTRAQTHIELVDAATNPALETLAMLAVAGFVLYGASRVFSQQLEPHLFFAAVVCLAGIFDPVRKMGNVNNRLQAADASARRLFELLDLSAEEPAAVVGEPESLPALREGIEFRGVAFAYPGTPRPVLADIDLYVRKGEMVALVGPNGSGKTTLVSLLLRFHVPTRGQILIDGRDIRTVGLASLRRQIGLVTQEAIVFTGTLRENIAYGAADATEAQVQQAARLARVEDLARDLQRQYDGQLASGYEAPVCARTLSGGERQRIALARAVLRDPPILILDEATSQVDSASEHQIQAALDDVTRDRTTFIIAHRYSTIARADRIVVLHDGRIVGTGTHDELLKGCPFYVSLCQTQFAHAGP